MGQHKYNPTAQAAKEGKLPPKPKKKSKIRQERELYEMIEKLSGIDTVLAFTRGRYNG